MDKMAKKRPCFTQEMESCIAVAKNLAAKENSNPSLDSLHIVKAAVLTVPEMTKAIFEKAGYSWQHVQKCCSGTELDLLNQKNQRPMHLVEQLEEIVTNLIKQQNAENDFVADAERCLSLILENPSKPLQEFLEQVPKTAQPFSSFREYFTAKKQLWLSCLNAYCEVENSKRGYKPQRPAKIEPPDPEEILNKVVHQNEQISQKVEKSSKAMHHWHQILSKCSLSQLQTDIIEILLIHEVYGIFGVGDGPTNVRMLSAMIEPETYPRKCGIVIAAIKELIEKDIIDLLEPDSQSCLVSSRVRLRPDALIDFLDCFENDVIDESDAKAARRWIYESDTLPF